MVLLKGWLDDVLSQLDHKNLNMEVDAFKDASLPSTAGQSPLCICVHDSEHCPASQFLLFLPRLRHQYLDISGTKDPTNDSKCREHRSGPSGVGSTTPYPAVQGTLGRGEL